MVWQLIFPERERVLFGQMAEIGAGITLERSTLQVHEPADPAYPDVFVGKLKAEDRQALALGKPVKGVKLGAEHTGNLEFQLTESLAQGLHRELMKASDDAYILMWDGNKVPRGTQLAGHTVGWTQNGQVLSDKGEMIGVYDRILEYGGETGKEQQMIVFLTVKPLDQ